MPSMRRPRHSLGDRVMKWAAGLTMLCFVFTQPAPAQQPLPKPLADGLARPAAIAVGPGGRIYVSLLGERAGEGAIVLLDKGKAVLFVDGKNRIWRFDPKGKSQVFAAPDAFPTPPTFLMDLTVDPESGTLFVSD